MSVSILEVLENAGFDVKNNVDDANWLLGQTNQFEELTEEAEELTSDWEDYKYWIEEVEDKYGEHLNLPDFETWRKDKEKYSNFEL